MNIHFIHYRFKVNWAIIQPFFFIIAQKYIHKGETQRRDFLPLRQLFNQSFIKRVIKKIKEDVLISIFNCLKRSHLLRFPLLRFCLYRSQIQLSIVSFNGIIVHKDSISRLAIYSQLSYVIIFVAKLKDPQQKIR